MNSVSIFQMIESDTLLLNNLSEFIGKKVEIRIMPQKKENINSNIELVRGAFKKYADKSKLKREKYLNLVPEL